MLFAKGIMKHTYAVVSGECGDEVFGGYPWFADDGALKGDFFPWSGSMQLRNSILRPEIREKLCLDAYVKDTLHQSLESYDVSAVEDKTERQKFRLQRLCFDYFMPNLQERAVRMCEGVGLSVLTPLCDDRLAEYVYNVPWRLKTMGGKEKGLFRAAVADLLPERLRGRKKSPYPKTCSPVYANLIRDRVGMMIKDPHAPVWRLADRAFVEKLAGSELNPADTPWFGQLMAGPQMLAYLIQVNTWMEERNIAVEI
jgi:asparagine synthase (glutamine-hydrolysing)